jgi:acyl-CoA thioesterase FadM
MNRCAPLRRAAAGPVASLTPLRPHPVGFVPLHRTRDDRSRSSSQRRAAHTATAALSPRWLSDLKAQTERGINSADGNEARGAKQVAQQLEHRWLELLLNTEGFLSGPRWAGLDNYPVLWGEMDKMGHVNNVTYNRYAESSRVNWFTNFAQTAEGERKQQWIDLMTPQGLGLILKSIKTDYKLPIVYPDSVTVLHKLLAKPTTESTNVNMEVVIISHSHQRVAARCFEDIVIYDYQAGKPTSLHPYMVEELGAAYDLQQVAQQKAIQEVKDLQKTLA